MRDPDRIDPMIEQLRAAWKANPDLRLGQLVYNAVRPAEPCPRLFFVEDGVLLAGLPYVNDYSQGFPT